MGKRWSTDLRRFVDEEPSPALKSDLRLRVYVTEIVKAATALNARRPRETALRCRRYQQRTRCPGRVEVRLQDLPAEIHWRCGGCGEDGVIFNWPRSRWDLSRKSSRTQGSEVTIRLDEQDYSALRGIDFIDPSSEHLVFSARPQEGTVCLAGDLPTFKSLVADLEAAAERERLETRRSRLGGLSEMLNCHLDSLAAGHNGLIPPGPLPRGSSLSNGPLRGGDSVVRWEAPSRGEDNEEAWAGLSASQLTRLAESDWESADGPLRFHPHQLGLQARHVPAMRNLLLLLRYLKEAGPLLATRAGNLKRAQVMHLLEELPMAEEVRQDPGWSDRQWNEADFPPLHLLRLLAQKSGLIELSQKYFRLTSKGGKLMQPARAGDLYILAFRTYFRRLDREGFDRLPSCPQVGRGIGYALYSLQTTARDWCEVSELSHLLLLPDALAHLARTCEMDFTHYLVEARILLPLEQFGLLERRDCPSLSPSGGKEVRLTELFDRLLEFNV
ncbi:MAG TPA: hypothetical protein VLU25_11420 [Acidobacteriota bacterium]|nr:hypothetical protein [Acidobacteriota bacterium]